MADIFTKSKRSEVMSRIRGHGNRDTELALINLMRKNRVTGWRRKLRVYGKPDFVFPKQRIAVFVDGCFWHGCPVHGTQPGTNASFWTDKIARNKTRDRKVNRMLRDDGWKVLRIWEHDLRRKTQHKCLRRLTSALATRS